MKEQLTFAQRAAQHKAAVESAWDELCEAKYRRNEFLINTRFEDRDQLILAAFRSNDWSTVESHDKAVALAAKRAADLARIEELFEKKYFDLTHDKSVERERKAALAERKKLEGELRETLIAARRFESSESFTAVRQRDQDFEGGIDTAVLKRLEHLSTDIERFKMLCRQLDIAPDHELDTELASYGAPDKLKSTIPEQTSHVRNGAVKRKEQLGAKIPKPQKTPDIALT